MGWSADFLSELASPTVSPKYILEFVMDYHEVIGEEGAFSSHSTEYSQLIGSEVSVGGGRVQPGSWSYTKGGWSVLVIDDEANGDVYTLLQQVVRGNYAVLRVGFAGWADSDFETVALGALSSVSGTAPEFVFEFDSILTHWATRHAVDAAQMALFDSIDANDADLTRENTTVTASWPVGDATINVSSTSDFARGSSGKGALLCSDDFYGDPFYVIYTGETSTTFTGVATGDMRLTSPVPMGISTPAQVFACAYLDGHPCDIAREVLVSTGDGVHGTHDDLPRSWGFAAFEDWVDDDDIIDIKAIIGDKSGNDHDWQVIVEEGQTDAIGWLNGLLSEAGIWLTMRQGKVTIRAAQNTDMDSSKRYEDLWVVPDFELTDDDIIEVQNYQFFFNEMPTEAATCSAAYYASHNAGTLVSGVSVTTDVTSLPAVTLSEHDLTDVVFDSSSQPATDVIFRCHLWECRVPEYVKVTCAGLRCAQLCPGDVIPVTSSQLRGRMDRTADGWDAVDAMVIGVSVSWMDGTVELELVAANHEFGT